MPQVDNVLQLSSEFNLLAILTSFAKEVGTDGTNFRIQHLLDAKDAQLPTPFIPLLKRVINIVLAGKAPLEIQPFLAGARLTALCKPNGDVRPIAAGNIFRRIAAKCACSLLKARVRALLSPLQLGVAFPAGCERIVHTMRKTLAEQWHDPDFVVLKVDFSNAFNSVSRRVLLEECQQHFPELLPWVYYCYGSVSHLFYQDEKIDSCVGVQQGDPLGPLLFCLVLHTVVSKIHAQCPGLNQHSWFLDDGVLCGPSADVIHAFGIISRFGPDCGLHLNLSKCELFSSDSATFDNIFHDNVLGNITFPRELFQRSQQPHFILLGAPIGDETFCTDHVQRLRTSNRTVLDSLSKLEDPQVALHLLRTCISFCKYVYIARTTPSHLILSAVKDCDEDILSCFESFAALQLSESAIQQAQLSLSFGGLGLRSLVRHCAPAFIASHLLALPELLTPDLREACTRFAQSLGSADMAEADVADMIVNRPSQRKLSSRLDRYDRVTLVAASPIAQRLRLESLLHERTAAWLQAIPSRGPFDLTFSPDEMQMALKHRLGLPLAEPGDECPACGSELDLLGHHHITCSTDGFVSIRHNRIRDALYWLLVVAGLNPEKEQGANADDSSRPGDVWVPNLGKGKPVAFDLTVVSPLTDENLKAAGEIDVVLSAERAKRDRYGDNCRDRGWGFVPLAVDSYGRWGNEAHLYFAKFASRLAVRTKVSQSVALSSLYRTLGVVLARQNARSILSRISPPLQVGAREMHRLASHPS